jgi:Formyl transferase
MRIALVTSSVLTRAKREIVAGIGARLVGIAMVPPAPAQVGFARHLRGLIVYGWPHDLHRLALASVARQLAAVLEPLMRPAEPWTPRGLARRLDLPFLAVGTLSDPRLKSWLAGLKCDLVVSLQSHRVTPELLNLPRLGWLNLHHGRLPDYRGIFSVFWAMANNEPVLYVTAHLMNDTVDGGPVVIEQPVAVTAGATVDEMEARMWAETPAVALGALRLLEAGGQPSPQPRHGGRRYSYPRLVDMRAAWQNGVRLR